MSSILCSLLGDSCWRRKYKEDLLFFSLMKFRFFIKFFYVFVVTIWMNKMYRIPRDKFKNIDTATWFLIQYTSYHTKDNCFAKATFLNIFSDHGCHKTPIFLFLDISHTLFSNFPSIFSRSIIEVQRNEDYFFPNLRFTLF